jgi:hypothetical protein
MFAKSPYPCSTAQARTTFHSPHVTSYFPIRKSFTNCPDNSDACGNAPPATSTICPFAKVNVAEVADPPTSSVTLTAYRPELVTVISPTITLPFLSHW